MTNWLIREATDPEKFLSLYGWAGQSAATRFATQAEAQAYIDQHSLRAIPVGMSFDDNRRPDVRTDYDPFGLGTSNLAGKR